MSAAESPLSALSPSAARCWQNVAKALPPSDPSNPLDPSTNLDTLAAITHAAISARRELTEALADIRGYVLACIGDVEGQRAIEKHRVLTLTAGQVHALAEGLTLIDLALAAGETP